MSASSYNVTPSGATRTTVLNPTTQSMSSEAAAVIGSTTISQPIQGGGQPALPEPIEGSNPTTNGGINFGGVINERTGRLAGGGVISPPILEPIVPVLPPSNNNGLRFGGVINEPIFGRGRGGVISPPLGLINTIVPPSNNNGLRFGGVINEPIFGRGRGGLLQPYPFNMPITYGNGRLIGPVLVSERIGRLAGGELYGPPPTLTTPGNVAMANVGNAGQPTANAAIIRNILAGGPVTTGNVVALARPLGNEIMANVGSLITNMRGTPEQLTRTITNMIGGPVTTGNVVALARPLGNEMITEIGGANPVIREATQGQVATVGGVATEQNVQNPLLTEYLNAVYTPVITRTIGSPTNIVVRRTVGNVGTATLGNVQGGLTISGQQGSVYIPAQQLLAATAT